MNPTEVDPSGDSLLIHWIWSTTLEGLVVFLTIAAAVFVGGRSGWWFLLVLLTCFQESLFKALRRRFQIEKE